MRFFSIIAALALTVTIACKKQTETKEHEHGNNSVAPADTIKKSIPKEVHTNVAGAHVMIKYHAPAVRNRTIWGGLVPFGEVWVTGAHSATSMEIDKVFIVSGTEIPAGKYALFTIPNKDRWTIIVNKNWDQHLADEYDQKDDIVRVEVVPESLSTVQERLLYAVVPSGTGGEIQISWEKVKVSLPFTIK